MVNIGFNISLTKPKSEDLKIEVSLWADHKTQSKH